MVKQNINTLVTKNDLAAFEQKNRKEIKAQFENQKEEIKTLFETYYAKYRDDTLTKLGWCHWQIKSESRGTDHPPGPTRGDRRASRETGKAPPRRPPPPINSQRRSCQRGLGAIIPFGYKMLANQRFDISESWGPDEAMDFIVSKNDTIVLCSL